MTTEGSGPDGKLATDSAGPATDSAGSAADAAGLAAAAEATRVQLSHDLAAVLATAARTVRVPALVVALVPVAPALFLLALAIVVENEFRYVAGAVGALGLLASSWLLWRRGQLLAAVDPRDELAADIVYALDVADAWAEGEETWERIKEIGDAGWGPVRVLRALWTGFQFSQDLMERVTERPRLAPFMPPRLYGLAWLGASCLASTAASLLVIVSAIGLQVAGALS
ncbi:MAG TPA: hypothetical protein VIP77_18900 [Jiangellaceae bacterium]